MQKMEIRNFFINTTIIKMYQKIKITQTQHKAAAVLLKRHLCVKIKPIFAI